jgi:hypothetical protein
MFYLNPLDPPPREPLVENHGLFAIHDQRCAVLSGEHAVLELGQGVFHPSWKAQSDGWHLVHADTVFKRWLVRTFLRR